MPQTLGFCITVRNQKLIVLFIKQTYVVGAQKSRLIVMIVLVQSYFEHHLQKFNLMDKKLFTI